MTTTAKFGTMEGKAVRFTDQEAWWYAQGGWRPIHPAEVGMHATTLSEGDYVQRFDALPPLPEKAFA
jgi:hypothetical protein